MCTGFCVLCAGLPGLSDRMFGVCGYVCPSASPHLFRGCGWSGGCAHILLFCLLACWFVPWLWPQRTAVRVRCLCACCLATPAELAVSKLTLCVSRFVGPGEERVPRCVLLCSCCAMLCGSWESAPSGGSGSCKSLGGVFEREGIASEPCTCVPCCSLDAVCHAPTVRYVCSHA